MTEEEFENRYTTERRIWLYLLYKTTRYKKSWFSRASISWTVSVHTYAGIFSIHLSLPRSSSSSSLMLRVAKPASTTLSLPRHYSASMISRCITNNKVRNSWLISQLFPANAKHSAPVNCWQSKKLQLSFPERLAVQVHQYRSYSSRLLTRIRWKNTRR